MTSKPRTHFEKEALFDRKASKMRIRGSESLLSAKEFVGTGLKHKQQVRKTADKSEAEPFYIDHI